MKKLTLALFVIILSLAACSSPPATPTPSPLLDAIFRPETFERSDVQTEIPAEYPAALSEGAQDVVFVSYQEQAPVEEQAGLTVLIVEYEDAEQADTAFRRWREYTQGDGAIEGQTVRMFNGNNGELALARTATDPQAGALLFQGVMQRCRAVFEYTFVEPIEDGQFSSPTGFSGEMANELLYRTSDTLAGQVCP